MSAVRTCGSFPCLAGRTSCAHRLNASAAFFRRPSVLQSGENLVGDAVVGEGGVENQLAPIDLELGRIAFARGDAPIEIGRHGARPVASLLITLDGRGAVGRDGRIESLERLGRKLLGILLDGHRELAQPARPDEDLVDRGGIAIVGFRRLGNRGDQVAQLGNARRIGPFLELQPKRSPVGRSANRGARP